MSDNTPVNSSGSVTEGQRPRAFEAILYGGLAVGVLDFLDAIVFFGLRRVVIERLSRRQIAYRFSNRGSREVTASAILNRKK